MAKWGNILIDNGREEEAKNVIWPLIEYDLGMSPLYPSSTMLGPDTVSSGPPKTDWLHNAM